MSAANSAAKKRRAPPSTEPIRPQTSISAPATNPNVGLTLPQVISLIDKRLVHLETLSKETVSDTSNGEVESEREHISPEILDEFNARFEIMAEEIANLKNIVMNLQMYTMEVNKQLLEERNNQSPSLKSSNENIMVLFKDNMNTDPKEEEPVPVVPKWSKI
uniref:Uncharacterized protein n=1 Tax=viral metagenome TaxID=1070528 RepID=A0A6C0ICX7_9ZZZZ